MTKTIIFDFDGTIADSFKQTVNIINSLSEEFGFQKELNYEKIRSKSISQLIKDLRISFWNVPRVISRWRKELSKIIYTIKPTQIVPALKKLKQKGCVLGILTTNSEENVRKFLKANDLELFDFVCHGSSLFGKDKILKKIIKKYKINISNAIYVGDEPRDNEAAKKLNMKIIAVDWGFSSKELLEKSEPDAIVSSEKELADL